MLETIIAFIIGLVVGFIKGKLWVLGEPINPIEKQENMVIDLGNNYIQEVVTEGCPLGKDSLVQALTNKPFDTDYCISCKKCIR